MHALRIRGSYSFSPFNTLNDRTGMRIFLSQISIVCCHSDKCIGNQAHWLTKRCGVKHFKWFCGLEFRLRFDSLTLTCILLLFFLVTGSPPVTGLPPSSPPPPPAPSSETPMHPGVTGILSVVIIRSLKV